MHTFVLDIVAWIHSLVKGKVLCSSLPPGRLASHWHSVASVTCCGPSETIGCLQLQASPCVTGSPYSVVSIQPRLLDWWEYLCARFAGRGFIHIQNLNEFSCLLFLWEIIAANCWKLTLIKMQSFNLKIWITINTYNLKSNRLKWS